MWSRLDPVPRPREYGMKKCRLTQKEKEHFLVELKGGVTMSATANDKCPLCMEMMDLTDKQLKPCKCGYEICLWCWHRIMNMDQKDESGGRCPGCRSVYNKDRILGTSSRNQMHELCADKANYQKEQTKSHKQTSAKSQLGQSEPKDPNNVRVIQRKLVYIVGMPNEFASEKLLRQKNFLGQYGKIENIIIGNIGANQQIPDSGRVYVTYAREEEAVRCIQAVNGYILDGKPLKATFGVTRYCHIWLSNRVCYKTNCSYVHHKASAEDICTKDDVSVVCARRYCHTGPTHSKPPTTHYPYITRSRLCRLCHRELDSDAYGVCCNQIRLQHLMGMDTKGPQHRSGRTLPPPGDCSSRTTTCSGISKDICINAEGLLPNGANKNASLLPATTPRDSSLSSGSPSIANAVLHRRDDHESIRSNQQNLSDPKSQKYIPPGGRNRSSMTSVQHMQHSCRPIEGTSLESLSNMSLVPLGSKVHLNEQVDSNSDKSEASPQLGNDTSNSNQTTSAENGTSDTSQQKPQYSNVVSQGQVVSSRRFTILGRPKATGQIGDGTSCSTKLGLVKDDRSDCITISRSHLVSQSLEQPSQQASATVKSHAGAEKKNGFLDIIEKLVPGNHKQLLESTASHRSTVVQSMSSRPVPSNLSTSDPKSQATAGSNDLSDLKRKLASQNQLQLVNQQGAPVSNTVIARASLCHSTLNNQVNLTEGKRQDSAQGGHESFYNREMVRSGDIVPSHCSDCTMLSRPTSAVSFTDVAAPDRKERKRQACPPGFEKPHHSSDSGKSVYVSSPACSRLCPASDALVKDSCGITDQQDLPSWATDCLKDDGDVSKNLNVSTSSRLGSTDTNQRHGQFQGTFFSGWLNHPRLSPYPPHHKLEYRDGTTGSYMSTGGYDAFCQGTKSGMGGGMASTLLQQPTMSSPRDSCTNRNTDSGMNGPKIDISYPMYTLF
ncbi:hypothetical protein C2845_PM08G02030 [Panicum miliaceum]|uniref:CCR4-NOT transcription complex subunit 4 n=1 Tax=Panicum miliaceum TaxID=4540 RepID=A0A3L6R2Z0_PANMI|nr:hypothetical protein C2845_PM08G02030 [Panicum miliaceum]